MSFNDNAVPVGNRYFDFSESKDPAFMCPCFSMEQKLYATIASPKNSEFEPKSGAKFIDHGFRTCEVIEILKIEYKDGYNLLTLSFKVV